MAYYAKRALTIATVGILSATAVTIATDGLIQLPTVDNRAGGPVAAAPARRVGTTRIEYSNQYRFTIEFPSHLRLKGTTRYLPAVFNTYKHKSTFFYSVIGHGTVSAPTQTVYASRFLYSLNVSHLNRQTVPEHREGLFRYGLSLKSRVTSTPAMRVIHDVRVPTAIKFGSETRFLPVQTPSNVYSNIQLARSGLRIASKNRFIPSAVKTYRHKVISTFGISGAAVVQYFSGDVSVHRHRSRMVSGVRLSGSYYAEHAPIEIRDDDEEVLILAANYLLSDDDG